MKHSSLSLLALGVAELFTENRDDKDRLPSPCRQVRGWRDSESRCVTRSRVESPSTHEMKGASFQEVLSGFPGIRLPSQRPLYWQCAYLCELLSHFFS